MVERCVFVAGRTFNKSRMASKRVQLERPTGGQQFTCEEVKQVSTVPKVHLLSCLSLSFLILAV